MNKAHRDRIAFMRICSGKFEKGMEVTLVQQNKKIKLSQPQQFMAQDREIVEEAYAGDVIGVFDPGIFSIGDTLCSKEKFEFKKIPTFAPEHFARVTQKDTMKRKQFMKGITQIAQEGAIQVFQEINIGMEEIIVGGVGVLQFDVLEQRLKSEYNVDIKLEILPYQCVRWIDDQSLDPNTLNLTQDSKRVRDLKGRNLIIFMNNWGIKWALDQNKNLSLSDVGTIE
ncbi:peptide chain release factor 3 [Amedibacillus dolichus CAG:375]|nr:peptide chain release factor 3 [Amedibacillus dolichus CAG:375]